MTVYGLDERAAVALVDDRSRRPHDRLSRRPGPRPGPGSAPTRHRLLVPDAPAAELDIDGLHRAVRDGLAEQVEHLGQRSDSFALPAFRKWVRLLTDTRNAKAWPRCSPTRPALFGACLSVHENLEPVGWGGGNLRPLCAEFLDEAAGLLDALGRRRPPTGGRRPRLREWPSRGPGGRGPFARARRLHPPAQDQVERGDAAQAEAAAATAADLWALREQWQTEFPGGDADAEALPRPGRTVTAPATPRAASRPGRRRAAGPAP